MNRKAGAVVAILILLLIGVSFYFYQQNNKPKPPQKPASGQKPAQKPALETTAPTYDLFFKILVDDYLSINVNGAEVYTDERTASNFSWETPRVGSLSDIKSGDRVDFIAENAGGYALIFGGFRYKDVQYDFNTKTFPCEYVPYAPNQLKIPCTKVRYKAQSAPHFPGYIKKLQDTEDHDPGQVINIGPKNEFLWTSNAPEDMKKESKTFTWIAP